MNATVEAYVGLGANIGDAVGSIRNAVLRLGGVRGLRVTAMSSLYRTPAWGVTDQADFVNAVVRVDTALPPAELLDTLLSLERAAGRDRTRGYRWGPRELDLDLLLYGDECVDLPGLRVPHPHMHERAFVLVPLAEIAPALVIPGHGSVRVLVENMATADIEALR